MIPQTYNSISIFFQAFMFFLCYKNYQIILFSMQNNFQREKKKQWSQEENNLLKQLYPNYSSKRWKKISQIFRQKGFDRTQLQIRQRWTNFEDPALLFTQWTDEELQTLYHSYNKFGSKWCFIKKTIPGRTQNKIKNKFYGNIRIFLRFIVNYFNDTKQDTMWIHKINPSILNDIYKGTQQFKEFGNQMQEAIKNMNYNVDKIQLLSRIEIKQQIYRKMYNKIIEFYKTFQTKKHKNQQKGKKQILLSGESSLKQSQSVEYKESHAKKEKDYISNDLNSLNNNVTGSMIMSNYNSHFHQTPTLPMNPMYSMNKIDLANYPLLQMRQNMYPPFHNCWFYPN